MTSPISPSDAYDPDGPPASGPALAVQQQPAAPAGANRVDEPTPTPSSSPLGDLRRRAAERAAANYIDLRVPGWGDDPDEEPRIHIFVRCRPIKPSELQTIRDNRIPKGEGKKGKSNAWVDGINADAVILTCQEIWAHLGDRLDPADVEDGDRISLDPDEPYGAKTKFDKRLAYALGMYDPARDDEPPRAVQIATKLFLHEGNVAKAGSRLVRHSNLTDEREQQDFM